MMQVFVGMDSLLTKGYPLQSESDMPKALEDFIRDVGAPTVLMSDNSKVQIGKQVKTILRFYGIRNQQSEPGYQNQNQNPAERRIQEIKVTVQGILNRTGAPAGAWLLCALYVIFLFNHLATESIGWKTPIEVAFNTEPDISPLLQFGFWERVVYETGADEQASFPFVKESTGRWVGVAENKGDILTYQIRSDRTGMVVVRSNVRPFQEGGRNLRAEAEAAPLSESELPLFEEPIFDARPTRERVVVETVDELDGEIDDEYDNVGPVFDPVTAEQESSDHGGPSATAFELESAADLAGLDPDRDRMPSFIPADLLGT